MQLSPILHRVCQLIRRQPPAFRFGLVLGCGVLVFAGTTSLTSAAQSGNGTGANVDKPYLSPEANRMPDANDQMKMRDKKDKQVSFEAANEERKKQLSDDSAKLLTLAMALKAEVDKTNKDMLSMNVIRKADEIEKLAHIVKEKMKLTVGGN
jgi:hypothetical protein